MTTQTRFHHGIEVLGRGVLVELIDGQGVQRSLFQEMVVDHGALGGFHVEKLVVVELSSFPASVGVGKHRFKHRMELSIHGNHGRGQRRRAIGLGRS